MTRDTFDLFEPHDRGRFGENEEAEQKASSKPDKLLDLEMVLHYETHPGKPDDGAILVSDNGDENRAAWIPKKLCQLLKSGRLVQGTTKKGAHVQLYAVTVTTETWVAKEKGLI